MKYYLALLAVFLITVMEAQVGIGTNDPDPAAVLDIRSEITPGRYGGVKLPTLNLSQRNQIATPIPDGMMIYFSDGGTRCVQLYDATRASWINFYCMNEAPVASGVALENDAAFISQDLSFDSMAYSQTDAEGDAADTPLYQWYRADDTFGNNEVAITGATAPQYTLAAVDNQKFLRLGVRPTASSGASPGSEVFTSYTDQIQYAPTEISLVPQSSSILENAMPGAIELVFDYPYPSATDIQVSVSSSNYSRLVETAVVGITIPANTSAPFTTSVFNVFDNAVADGTSNLTFSITNVSGGLGDNTIGTVFEDQWQILDDDGGFTGVAQDFDTNTTWSYTPSPLSYAVGDDVWAVVNTLTSITNLNANFWGMRDLENPNGGGNFLHTLTFDSINISAGTNVKFSFDYESQDLNTGGERYGYELFYDGVSQGAVDLCNACNIATSGTVIINIPNTVNDFYVVVYGDFNGGSDIVGVDNFRLYQ